LREIRAPIGQVATIRARGQVDAGATFEFCLDAAS